MPAWAQIPAVMLATAATVIASQAVISGVFSVTRQAMQLGFVPRLNFRHTSGVKIGQVYSPALNSVLFVAVVALVLGFGSSSNLAGAYGIAVTGTMISTTILFLAVVRWRWRKPAWVVAAGGLAFLGGRAGLPRCQPAQGDRGAAGFRSPSAWRCSPCSRPGARDKGCSRRSASSRRAGCATSSRRSARWTRPSTRCPGTAVFLHARKETTPLALRENVDHNRVLHESVVIVSVDTVGRAHLPTPERLTVYDLGYEDGGISHVRARFGFRDEPNVPKALCLPAVESLERDIDFANVTYFLSQMTIVPTDAPAWGHGARSSSWPSRTPRRAPRTTSACRATGS